jgi:hypothetical protein
MREDIEDVRKLQSSIRLCDTSIERVIPSWITRRIVNLIKHVPHLMASTRRHVCFIQQH